MTVVIVVVVVLFLLGLLGSAGRSGHPLAARRRFFGLGREGDRGWTGVAVVNPGHRRGDGLAARRHPPVDRQSHAADITSHALATKIGAGGWSERDVVKSRRDAVDRV